MKSGVAYFRVVAILFIISGILGLVLPDQYISLLGADGSAGGRLWGRAFGAVSLGFGAMFWLLKPNVDQQARRTGAVGAALTFGLTGIGDVVSLLTKDIPAFGWAFVAFHVLMVGFAIYYLRTPAPMANEKA